MWPAQVDATRPELFLSRALKTETFYPCPAIIIGNGDTPAVQFTDRRFRSALRQSLGRFQAILKYLLDHIAHPLAAGVVEQRLPFVRHIGNDHDTPAFPLQVIDSGKLLSVVQEMNVFSNDRASSLLPQAVRGEVSGVFHKFAHSILQKDW
jgi:hypothetical protein